MSTSTAKRPSYLSGLCRELLRKSRQSGKVMRAPLKGGAELVCLVAGGSITFTVKRPNVRVGDTELKTFRSYCSVPADAEQLTPPEQGTRQIDGVTWYYVTFRWPDPEARP